MEINSDLAGELVRAYDDEERLMELVGGAIRAGRCSPILGEFIITRYYLAPNDLLAQLNLRASQ